MLRKRTGRRIMSLDDKVEAAFMLFIDKEQQKTVAKHFRTTVSCISALAKKVLNRDNFLTELLDK